MGLFSGRARKRACPSNPRRLDDSVLTDSVGVGTTTESVSVRRQPVAIDGVVPRGSLELAPGACTPNPHSPSRPFALPSMSVPFGMLGP